MSQLKQFRKINLFCLPFAGASIYAYRDFGRYIADFVNTIPIELPGRGSRVSEPLLSDINTMVEDVFNQINVQQNMPYAIFGHSLGSLLGFLLVKKIKSKKLPQPIHLFLSGRGGPSASNNNTPIHSLPKQEFIEKLQEYEGTPKEILQDKGVMDIFEPILRADFKAYETYVYEKSDPFEIPITVMIGTCDKTTYEDSEKWQEETLRRISIMQFKGGHFFIFNHLPEISREISNTLQKFI